MIEFSNEVFDLVARSLRSSFPKITVKGEYVDSPARCPCVTIDEIRNIPKHLDSSQTVKYAAVTYRVQIFCNTANKRFQAREIHKKVDELLMSVGLVCKSYTSVPAIYHAEIYSIITTYSGVIDQNGVIYRG